jgi:ATP-binding cassette, subfamily A (ABC1), member 3
MHRSYYSCEPFGCFSVHSTFKDCQQFLDEADLLADHIAILATPGKLVASGSPVALKRDLGNGYSIQVTFVIPTDSEKIDTSSRPELLSSIRTIAPETFVTIPFPHQVCYHLKVKDTEVVRQVLGLLDDGTSRYAIASYDILGTTIEDIFLDLMSKNETPDNSEIVLGGASSPHLEVKSNLVDLPTGRPVPPFRQAFTIFYKRTLILKRSWLTPLLTVIIGVAGATIPLVFINGELKSCSVKFLNATSVPLYLPFSSLVTSSSIVTSPPNITSTLGNTFQLFPITNVPDNATFVNFISQNFLNLSLGGVSLDLTTGASLIAWEATPPGITGLSMLNLATNLLYARALNMSGNAARIPTLVLANYATFPPLDASILVSLRWVFIFGAAMVSWLLKYLLFIIVYTLYYCRVCTLLFMRSMSRRSVDHLYKLCSYPMV